MNDYEFSSLPPFPSTNVFSVAMAAIKNLCRDKGVEIEISKAVGDILDALTPEGKSKLNVAWGRCVTKDEKFNFAESYYIDFENDLGDRTLLLVSFNGKIVSCFTTTKAEAEKLLEGLKQRAH